MCEGGCDSGRSSTGQATGECEHAKRGASEVKAGAESWRVKCGVVGKGENSAVEVVREDGQATMI